MKVLFISLVHPPEVASSSVMVSELAEDMAAQGHDVTIMSGWPNHPYGELFDGYKVRWRSVQRYSNYRLIRSSHAITPRASAVGRLWMYFSLAISTFFNALTLGRQDVVVCSFLPLFGGWVGWLLAKLWRGRFVNIVFDLWPEAIRNAGLISETHLVYRLTRAVDALNCRWSDAITTLGEGMKDEILARDIDPQKVNVIPFWVGTDKIFPMDRDNDWRREHNIAPDIFVAVYAGTIGYVSGAQILIRTAEILADRKDVLLLVVGEGVVKEELVEMSKRGNFPNLKLLPLQPAERLSAMLSTADVGLITLLPDSGFSSIPSKVLGYMAAGRAVIAAAPKDTDTARLVDEARIGLVTEVQDPEDLAKGILALADNRDECRQMGERARKHLVDNFSRETVVPRYVSVITGQQ